MKLDLDKAWQAGVRFVRNNASLLMVIGGLTFFLPSAIFGVLYQPPEIPDGATLEQQLDIIGEFWRETWWVNLIALILSTLGSLSIYRLAASRDDRTVSGALHDALRGFFPMVAASLLVGLPIGLLFGLIFGIGGLAILLVLFAIPFAIWLSMRMMLAGPVLMAEGDLNPVRALKRSFAITKGNSLRIFFFIILIAIGAMIALAVVGSILGLIFIAIAGADIGQNLTTIVVAVLESAVTVVVIACVAMIYRQLAAPKASAAGVPKSGE
ncbi:glycerophosphoryl diester phosphodiesterase membrane domain-containing protein [Pseudoblastomonas halimionae]|uniref:Glycerophosphoryl diester phosphodiesterase membrane domain-containing protein n=1 Tax=Alteriqipengyuania halimionae TaxID=1926630 RepID=A0A6I4U3B0_9SPHN|nr:glycerophosphoryl diester phosphodiesterase membrane domain-containing protein [Alteriqipengyuania halimionae]MXP10500.1 hypothetical protein [Alteriqipengyuania halimionae]